MSSEEDVNEASKQTSKADGNDDSYDDYVAIGRNSWDPFHSADWDMEKPTIFCLTRIKRDISNLFRDPPPGMFITPDPDNLTKIHALIVGPDDTPYKGGFFYFMIRCPSDYPIRPPRCRLMTTGNNTVRFNPNLYANGKVCLSILGTWSGPSWSPAQTIASLLISIQSLMSENPYHNEPGYEQEHHPGEKEAYNEIIQHETLRVAVCEMIENERSCPKQLHETIIQQFHRFYDSYIDLCKKNLQKDKTAMTDPFGDTRGSFTYSAILKRLNKIHSKLHSGNVTNIVKLDAYTEQIIHDGATCYDNCKPSKEEAGFDDIFNNLDDDDDDDDDEELDEE